MKTLLALSALTLAACSNAPSSIDSYFKQRGLATTPTAEDFQHCHGYGCKHKTAVSIDKSDWKIIEKSFKPRPKNAEAERAAIAKSMADFEKIIGAQAGTQNDHWGTFRKLGDNQHDCVDESLNASIYISLLIQRGLITRHTLEAPQARVPIFHAGRWPHQAATIRETKTNQVYIVDTWWDDNGAPAHILPIEEWRDGWRPEHR